jgi:hypothetical protein
MAKRITRIFLATALVLAVGALGIHAAAHFHGNASDEQHCQICHVGHSAIPQPAIPVTGQVPLSFARLTIAEDFTPYLEAGRTLSIPRAPPA